jgi:hypothetical protein
MIDFFGLTDKQMGRIDPFLPSRTAFHGCTITGCSAARSSGCETAFAGVTRPLTTGRTRPSTSVSSAGAGGLVSTHLRGVVGQRAQA